jgi:hypothetical protein
MRLALLFVLVGCAEPSTPRKFGDRDLGPYLQPPGADDGGAPDLAQLKLDLSGGGGDLAAGDLARAADLAGAADLSTVVDLAQPPINEPPIYVHTARTLYKLDPNTYDLALIGDFNVGVDITDIAEKDDGSLVAISFTSVYSVDPASGQATLLWDNFFQDMNALTYLSDGRLLSADLAGNVFQLDMTSNSIFMWTLGNYGSSQTTAGDLVSVDDGTTWGLTKTGGVATDTNNVLMIVNNVNGTGTPKGPTGFGQLWGAAYSAHRILGFSGAGEIVEIDPFTGAGTLLRTYAGYSFFGATSSPAVLQ